MLSIMKKNISLLMCGRCTRTDTHDVGLKEGKRLKYVHVRAHVNVCPHSVTTLDQDMDRQGSRLREGTFGEEVLASDFFSAETFSVSAVFPDAEAPGLAQQQVSWRKHSTALPELPGQGMNAW